MAIVPQSAAVSLFQSPMAQMCQIASQSAPSGQFIVSLPMQFRETESDGVTLRTYTRHLSETERQLKQAVLVMEFPFDVSSARAAVHLFADASTDFFLADSELRIRREGTDVSAVGVHQKNHNSLRANVPPGKYFIGLYLLPTEDGLPQELQLPCVQYNFYMHAEEAVFNPSHSIIAHCQMLGEVLPESLNTVRYFGRSGQFSMSTMFRQPAGTSHAIYFAVDRMTRMRFATFSLNMNIELKLDLVPTRPSASDMLDMDSLRKVGAVELRRRKSLGASDEISIDALPEKHYVLWLIFDRAPEVSLCDTFSMSMSGVPLTQIMDKVNGQDCVRHNIPAVLPRKLPTRKTGGSNNGQAEYWPTHYDSSMVGQRLVLKQMRGSVLKYEATFQVTEPVHLHIDISFAFPLHSLDLRLEPSDTPAVPETIHYTKDRSGVNVVAGRDDTGTREEQAIPHILHGRPREGGRTLNVRELQRGYWRLVVEELEPTHNPHYVTCIDFSIRFNAIAVVAHNPPFLSTSLQVPPTLDSVGFSRDQGWARLFGDFPVLLTPPRANQITFTVRQDSLFRVYVASHDVIDIDLHLLKREESNEKELVMTHSIREIGEETILELLKPGAYTLRITYMPGTSGFWPASKDSEAVTQDVLLPPIKTTFNLDLAIAPASFIKQMIQVFGGSDASCTLTSWPSISLNRRGFFKFTGDRLTIPGEASKKGRELVSEAFSLQATSEVFFEIGYDFLLNGLALRLDSTSPGESMNPIYGYNHGNTNQLTAQLPAGSYRVVLYQPSLSPPDFVHCIAYSLVVHIASLSHLHQRHCDMTHQLPSDLNTQHGGTHSYGGPMQEGRSRISISNIALPVTPPIAISQATRSITGERIVFSIEEDSVLRVFTHTDSPQSKLRLVLSDLATGSFVPPVQSGSLSSMETALWNVEARHGDRGRGLALDVVYDRVDSQLECPSFDFRLEIEPRDVLLERHACPDYSEWRLPKPLLAGPVADDHLAWYIGTELLHTALKGGDWSHDITVQVTEVSTFVVALGYHFVPTAFFLELTRADEDDLNDDFYAHSVGDVIGTHNSFAHRLAVDLEPGMYVLHIRANTGFVDISKDYCFPFVYDALLTPVLNVPVISSVLPPTATDLRQGTPLSIAIRFSKTPYTALHERIRDLSDNEVSQLATLVPQAPISSNTIYCSSFRYAGYGAAFRVEFDTSLMQPHTTYKLHIATALFFDGDGKSFTFTDSCLYAIDPDAQSTSAGWEEEIPQDAANHAVVAKCGHGKENADGSCKCEPGFAGIDCSRCAPHFTPAYMSTELYCFIECGSHGAPDAEPGTYCNCHTGYTGAHCHECATGYVREILNEASNDHQCVPAKVEIAPLPPVLPLPVPMPSLNPEPEQVLVQTPQYHDVSCGQNGKPALVSSEVPCDCDHGFTGKFCERCIGSFIEDDSTGTRRCLSREVCDQLMCHSHGTCQPFLHNPKDVTRVEGVVQCTCDEGYGSRLCDTCADGFAGYPNCVAAKTCAKPCLNGGHCDGVTGRCVCPTYATGSRCENCQGENCDNEDRVTQVVRYVGVVVSGFLVIGGTFYAIVRIVRGRQGIQYMPVATDDVDDEYREGYHTGTGKRTAMLGLVDDDDSDWGGSRQHSRTRPKRKPRDRV
eukprot:c12290_g1_i1.p1 GENE.c12290_g1_i1~~c12290_g1_i1.p1  ORF type:complete len:1644 (+),score=320.13 c12290_g1_i1:22-4932(+)